MASEVDRNGNAPPVLGRSEDGHLYERHRGSELQSGSIRISTSTRRKVGTPNTVTADYRARYDELAAKYGCPIELLFKPGTDTEVDTLHRISALRAVLSWTWT